jgi:hypothetical protein
VLFPGLSFSGALKVCLHTLAPCQKSVHILVLSALVYLKCFNSFPLGRFMYRYVHRRSVVRCMGACTGTKMGGWLSQADGT